MNFAGRSASLPMLGIGISTEFGVFSIPSALDMNRLRADWPQYSSFIEVGVTADLGIDEFTRDWVNRGSPLTFHFLDLNLGEPADFDECWISKTLSFLSFMKPAWICGDAGQWHFNSREPAHGFLQPPILSKISAREIADGIIALREITGYEVLPENPPGIAFIGNLHLLDFFALVCDLADTGMVLDCAHLWMYQHAMKLDPCAAFDSFPFDRVTEVHVAGGQLRQRNGFRFIEDNHGVEVLSETWEIFDETCRRAKNIRAIALEGERNSVSGILPTLRQIEITSQKYSLFKNRARG